MQEENRDQQINEASVVDPVITFAMSPISNVAFSAGAAVRAMLVHTAGARVTKMTSIIALIGIKAKTTIAMETVIART